MKNMMLSSMFSGGVFIKGKKSLPGSDSPPLLKKMFKSGL